MEFVVIYRSAHPQAEGEATEIVKALTAAGIAEARMSEEDEPGASIKSVIVEVPEKDAYNAQAVLRREDVAYEGLDAASGLDFQIVFSSERHDAENETMAVKGLLDANGIAAFRAESTPYPNLPHTLLVRREDAARAREVIETARATGPVDAEMGAQASAETAGEND